MYLGTILVSLFAYLFGSISWSIIIVYWKKRKDIRTLGSKNAGATNASRVIGKGFGFLIVFLDSFKVILSALVAMLINMIPNDLFNRTSLAIPSLMALIGHCYPIYYKFKGGKAVSCFIGLAFVVNMLLAVIFTIIWWVSIFIWRKVSLSSIISAIIVVIIGWLPWLYGMDKFYISGIEGFNYAFYEKELIFSWANKWHEFNLNNHSTAIRYGENNQFISKSWYESLIELNICLSLGGLILVIKHNQNIKRLFNKTEPNYFEWKKNPKK